jgi:hypothetical protein
MNRNKSWLTDGAFSKIEPHVPTRTRGHCQSKFYTACSRTGAGGSSTVFAHELPTRSAGFDAENRLYLFALTVPSGGHFPDSTRSPPGGQINF